MGDYNRSTTEINFANISPDILQAIHKYIELHNLGDILNGVTHCIVSTSEKIKKGLFSGPGPKLLVETAILTNRWLILADRVDQNAVFIKSMQLQDIVIEDYEKSLFYSKIPDTGLNITGRFTDASEQGMIFLPLGKDIAGDTFKEALIHAAQEAKK
ncbi:hypothetical protein [Candidatus Villigracilis affinis]|uniref:hypothetical protein n=1 Tax=Candidatus Villigracilis affinis TaxID=3140682 RepID=UPI001D5C3C7F|nr:hypothetical protein [Anaerolineales bacterium]